MARPFRSELDLDQDPATIAGHFRLIPSAQANELFPGPKAVPRAEGTHQVVRLRAAAAV